MAAFDRRAVARLDPYQLPDERIRVAMQEHWAAKVEPVATTALGLVLVLLIGGLLPARLGVLADVAWWLWFLLLARLAWSFLNWHLSWFIATNKRLLLLYGVVTKKVAMMPLSKVTDMSYSRSPLGQLLGYGTFTMESAGQEQALHQISFVRDPDRTYRTICQEIFGEEARSTGGAGGYDDDDDGPDDPGSNGGPRRSGPDHPSPDPTDLPVQRIGTYLLPSDRSSFGRRFVRRARRRTDDNDGDDQRPAPPGFQDEADGWQVSREHASTYERVPRRDEGWWD